MKTTLGTLLSVIFLFSCDKTFDDYQQLKTESVNTNVINQLLSLKNEENQRVAFNNLNESERLFLWKTRFENYLNNNVVTDEQGKFLKNIIATLPQNVFSSKAKTDNAVISKMDQLRIDFINMFGHKIAKLLLTHISDKHETTETVGNDKGEIGPNTMMPDCSCSSVSDWCDCSHPMQCYYCGSAFCSNTEYGCGTFWMYRCNGQCRQMYPQH